jgi:hypothetical protein
MRSALAVENVSWFSDAFAFATMWLAAAADVGANLIASDNFLLGRSDWFLLDFRHFQVSLGQGQGNLIEYRFILGSTGCPGNANLISPRHSFNMTRMPAYSGETLDRNRMAECLRATRHA